MRQFSLSSSQKITSATLAHQPLLRNRVPFSRPAFTLPADHFKKQAQPLAPNLGPRFGSLYEGRSNAFTTIVQSDIARKLVKQDEPRTDFDWRAVQPLGEILGPKWINNPYKPLVNLILETSIESLEQMPGAWHPQYAWNRFEPLETEDNLTKYSIQRNKTILRLTAFIGQVKKSNPAILTDKEEFRLFYDALCNLSALCYRRGVLIQNDLRVKGSYEGGVTPTDYGIRRSETGEASGNTSKRLITEIPDVYPKHKDRETDLRAYRQTLQKYLPTLNQEDVLLIRNKENDPNKLLKSPQVLRLLQEKSESLNYASLRLNKTWKGTETSLIVLRPDSSQNIVTGGDATLLDAVDEDIREALMLAASPKLSPNDQQTYLAHALQAELQAPQFYKGGPTIIEPCLYAFAATILGTTLPACKNEYDNWLTATILSTDQFVEFFKKDMFKSTLEEKNNPFMKKSKISLFA